MVFIDFTNFIEHCCSSCCSTLSTSRYHQHVVFQTVNQANGSTDNSQGQRCIQYFGVNLKRFTNFTNNLFVKRHNGVHPHETNNVLICTYNYLHRNLVFLCWKMWPDVFMSERILGCHRFGSSIYDGWQSPLKPSKRIVVWEQVHVWSKNQKRSRNINKDGKNV